MRIKLPLRALVAGALVFAIAGCSTPDSRIADNQSAFDAYSPETKQLIRAGRAAVGFSPEQAKMALGEPDRVYSRTTAAGRSEVWAYEDHSPTFGFGVGGGFGSGGSTAIGTGVGVSTGGDYPGDKMRVVFENGRVSAIEELAE